MNTKEPSIIHPNKSSPPPEGKGRNDLLIQPGSGGRLLVTVEGKTLTVHVRLCFPLTDHSRYISLRDEKHAEIALIDDLANLSPDSREAVERAMAIAGFLLEISRIESIEKEFDLRNWKVNTQQGMRTFQTRLDAWPRPLPDGGLLIRDISGDLYRISRPEQLDPRSRKILWPYAD